MRNSARDAARHACDLFSRVAISRRGAATRHGCAPHSQRRCSSAQRQTMSSDSEADARSVMSRSRAAARSARPRKGSPSSDDDLQQSAPAQDGTCFLCGKVLGKDTMWFKGKTFHKPACWLAVRCYRRTFPDKNQLELADRRMASDAAGWRSSVLPLVRVPGGTRDSSAREALKKKHRTIDRRDRL